MDIFKQLGTIESDQKKLEDIEKLQTAFNSVKTHYSQEYNSTLSIVMEEIVSRLKNNAKMSEAVDIYVNSYVKLEKKIEATEALYKILAAEMVQTVQTLSHTTCTIF